jgi:hypothetical protein
MTRKRNGENRSEVPAASADRGVLETLVFTLFIEISLMFCNDWFATME